MHAFNCVQSVTDFNFANQIFSKIIRKIRMFKLYYSGMLLQVKKKNKRHGSQAAGIAFVLGIFSRIVPAQLCKIVELRLFIEL